jgi:hypothetical protein
VLIEMVKISTACFCLILFSVSVRAQTDYKTYVNHRFGFSISYPSYLIQGRLPDNGAGTNFNSPDGSLSVSVQGHYLNGSSLSAMWKEALAAYGNSVTYKVKRNNWFVISGVANDFEYYRKTFVQGGNWCSFVITYPHNQSKRYDPVVEVISKGFIPFIPGDFDRLP